MILILGGPSGVGKSSLGEYLQREAGFTHYEFDIPFGCPAGPDKFGFRQEWDLAWNGIDSKPLAQRLAERTVITIPGFPWFSAKAPVPAGVVVKYLVGPAGLCLSAFEKREKETDRWLPSYHWLENGIPIFRALASGDIPPAWQVAAFEDDGSRRSRRSLASELMQHLGILWDPPLGD